MKERFTISIDTELFEKVKRKSEEMGITMSELTCVALMAMIDRKALLKHTGGLFKQIGELVGREITRQEIVEVIKE